MHYIQKEITTKEILIQEELPQKSINNFFLGTVSLVIRHKALGYKYYRKKYHKSVQGYDHRNNKFSNNQRSINYNSSSPLLDYNIECYK